MGTRTWRVLVGGALAVALTTLTAACGSSSDSGDTTSDTGMSKAAISKALGPEKEATGTPLKVGYVYAGQAQAVDNENEGTLAEATAKYVNEHLGGVAGHPIDLRLCADHGTPAGATECANELLRDDVAIVLAGNPVNSAPVLDVLEPEKVPFFVQTAAEAALVTSPDASILGNPIAFLAAAMKNAQDADVEKEAIVYVDIPAAAQLPAIGKPLFQNGGIELIGTAVPLGTPDVTPQIQAAITDGAEQFLIVGDVTLCVNSLKALKTLDFDGEAVSNMNCVKDPSADAIPGGWDGLVVPTTRVQVPSNPETEVVEAVAAKYAPGTPTDDTGQAVLGYIIVSALQRAMTDLDPAQATAAGISAELLAMSPQPVPLLPGQTFQCDRKKSTLTPASCSNGIAIVTYDADGKPVEQETFDATPYLDF
jgi:branched-chain amino acid transport system substrate-binding protein